MASRKAASVPLQRKPKSLSKTRSATAKKGFSVQFPLFKSKVLPPLGSEQRPLSHLSMPGSKSKSKEKTISLYDQMRVDPTQAQMYDPVASGWLQSKSKSKSKSKEKPITLYEQMRVDPTQAQMYDPFASGWFEYPLGSEQRPLSHLSIADSPASSKKTKSKSKTKKSKRKSESRNTMSVQFPLFKPKNSAPKAAKRKVQSR